DGSVAVLALLAGNDMILTTDYAPQIAQVLAAVESGVIDEARIDEACTRVLRAKIALGLLALEE
ncbi:MAG: beta-hexosaminidase, partial [Oscillospiraceae bacterium]|nr:beta-hexosaminidase [Oscillospiraceae bacterium]